MASTLLAKRPPKFRPPPVGETARSRIERAASMGCKVVLTYSSEAEFQALGREIVARGLEDVGLRRADSAPGPKKSALQLQIVESRKREASRQLAIKEKQARAAAKPKAPEPSVFDQVRAHKRKMSVRRKDVLLRMNDPEHLILRAINQIETRQRASVDIYALNDKHYLDLIRSKATLCGVDARPDIRIRKASEKPTNDAPQSTLNHVWGE